MLKNIKHIIFDLGGVILNIDSSRTLAAFGKYGIEDAASKFELLTQRGIFQNFEKGNISSDAFVHSLKTHLQGLLNDDQVVECWNAMLLDIPLRRLQILQQLQIYYDIFLLSNTNEIHESSFNNLIKSQTGFASISLFFDKVYYSHHTGRLKPEPEAFEVILKENNLLPEHTLFIDDSIVNINQAKELGLQTIWMQPDMSMEKDIFKPKTP